MPLALIVGTALFIAATVAMAPVGRARLWCVREVAGLVACAIVGWLIGGGGWATAIAVTSVAVVGLGWIAAESARYEAIERDAGDRASECPDEVDP